MFIQKPLRKECFCKSHDTHQGINSTANKLKKSVWWPHIGSNNAILVCNKDPKLKMKHLNGLLQTVD